MWHIKKVLEVYGILFGELNSLPPALTGKEGVFGAFTRVEDIIMRHSKLSVDMTLDVLESEKLTIEQKARMLFKGSIT